jgi:hypothetical protein
VLGGLQVGSAAAVDRFGERARTAESLPARLTEINPEKKLARRLPGCPPRSR